MPAAVPTLTDLVAVDNQFPRAVHRWAVDFSAETRRQLGDRDDRFSRAHRAAQESFANYLAGECADPFDQRMASLWFINREVRSIRREAGEDVGPDEFAGLPAFSPTDGQRQILRTVGDQFHQPAPPPDLTLEEIVTAGVRDLIAASREIRGKLRERALDADETLAEAKSVADQQLGEEMRSGRLKARVEQLEDELAGRESTIDELHAHLDGREVPRRWRVADGIYRNKSGGLEAWVPGSGSTKGKHVPVDDLAEARRIRGEAPPEPETGPTADDQDAAYEAALEAKAKELGREPTDEEAAAIGKRVKAEFAKSTAATSAAEEVT